MRYMIFNKASLVEEKISDRLCSSYQKKYRILCFCIALFGSHKVYTFTTLLQYSITVVGSYTVEI